VAVEGEGLRGYHGRKKQPLQCDQTKQTRALNSGIRSILRIPGKKKIWTRSEETAPSTGSATLREGGGGFDRGAGGSGVRRTGAKTRESGGRILERERIYHPRRGAGDEPPE